MNKVVKSALVALVGVLGFNANAQDLGLTVKGGLNINSVSLSEEVKGLESKVGFHIGAAYEIPVADIISIEAGVFFDTRGLKTKEERDLIITKRTTEGNTNLYSLNIPVTGKVRIGVSDINIFLQAGPYANILLSGTEKREVSTFTKASNTTTNTSSSEDIEFGENKDVKDRFDYGLTFGGGVEFKKFVLSAGYDLGLRNFAESSEGKVKFNAIKIGVGYKF